MRLYVIEGTPDEISDVMTKMPASTPVSAIAKPVGEVSKNKSQAKSEDGPNVFVSEAFARRALTRLKLSLPMKKTLEVLLKASGEWVGGAELHKASGYTPAQFAGLMGAFGRRLAHTHGYDEEAYFWDWKEAEDGSGWHYRLPESVINVLSEGDIL